MNPFSRPTSSGSNPLTTYLQRVDRDVERFQKEAEEKERALEEQAARLEQIETFKQRATELVKGNLFQGYHPRFDEGKAEAIVEWAIKEKGIQDEKGLKDLVRKAIPLARGKIGIGQRDLDKLFFAVTQGVQL